MPVHVLWTRFPLTARRLLDPFLFHNTTASEESGILSQLYLFSNFFIEAWFAMDIFLNFITGYVTPNNKLVMDRWLVFTNYLLGWFVVDGVSSFPWELFYFDSHESYNYKCANDSWDSDLFYCRRKKVSLPRKIWQITKGCLNWKVPKIAKEAKRAQKLRKVLGWVPAIVRIIQSFRKLRFVKWFKLAKLVAAFRVWRARLAIKEEVKEDAALVKSLSSSRLISKLVRTSFTMGGSDGAAGGSDEGEGEGEGSARSTSPDSDESEDEGEVRPSNGDVDAEAAAEAAAEAVAEAAAEAAADADTDAKRAEGADTRGGGSVGAPQAGAPKAQSQGGERTETTPREVELVARAVAVAVVAVLFALMVNGF